MNFTPEQLAQRSDRWTQLAWVVLALGMATALWFWQSAAETVQRQAKEAFDLEAQEHQQRLEQSLDHYGDLLYAFQAAFEANQQLDRLSFQRLYRALKLDDYPGLQALQFARWVPQADTERLLQEIRTDRSITPQGYPQVQLRPEGQRSHHLPVVYAEPIETNTHLLGFDQAADPVRRDVLERARDAGRVLASGPLQLVSGVRQARGFALRAPVYDPSRPRDTLLQRRAAFLGQVGCAVEVAGMATRVMPANRWHRLHWRLDDLGPEDSGTQALPAALFDSATQGAVDAYLPGADVQAADQRTVRVQVLGRQFASTLTRPPFHPHLQPYPLALLGGILTGSLALWWALRSIGQQQGEAAALAHAMTQDARDSTRQLQSVMDSTQDAIITLDARGHLVSHNRAARRLFRLPEPQPDLFPAPVIDIRQLMPLSQPEAEGHVMDVFALRGLTPDAPGVRMTGRDTRQQPLAIEVTVNRLVDHRLADFLLTVRDISAQLAAEEAYRAAQRQLDEVDEMRRVIVHHAPYAILVLNKSGVIQAINPAGEALLGYKGGELIGQSTTQRFFEPDEVAARTQKLALRLNHAVRDLQVLTHLAENTPGTPSEWTLIRADGRRIVAEISVTILKDEAQQMTGYLAMAHDVTSRTEAEQQLQHQAQHDALTGLPNRNMVQEHLKTALQTCEREGSHLALMFLDMDRFKKVNDTLGHHVGDSLIMEVARRLRSGMRTTDIVARLGGDEFVVLLPKIAHVDDGSMVAQKVLDLFNEPLRVGPHELRMTPSIGLVTYPAHGTDAATLMRHADLAMYQAKNLGRNRVQLFNSQLEAVTADTLALENELYKALERQELRLHFQPQFDCMSGRIIGAEALLRWEHQGKLVPPMDFIPFAEETGLIVPIGEWVLTEACRQAQAWRSSIGWPLRMAVNLSAVQLDRPDIAETVARALQTSGLDPRHLELEITETVVVRESLRAADVLTQLRALGLSVAIDDFGVGYSSFGYLRELPVDRFKLDRSFLTAIPQSSGDCRLAAALIAMAHRLDVGIVAEGVENAEQLAFLKAHHCDEVQGYHLGKPLTASAFEHLLRQHQAEHTAG